MTPHRLWIEPRISYTHGNAAQVGACGGAEVVNNRSLGSSKLEPYKSFLRDLRIERKGSVFSMPSQTETVARARALRGRLLAIAEACASAGIPLPMRRDLARLTGATRRQIDRHISYLRDIGRIEIERRQNRAWVQGIVQ